MSMTDAWLSGLSSFLLNRRWERRTCSGCGRTFFAKERNRTEVCGRGKCNDGQMHFLRLPRPRKPSSVTAVGENLAEALVTCGYSHREAVSVDRVMGQTDLVGAAVQILEPLFFGSATPPKNASFVFQPVIRMRYFTPGLAHEGSSSSFVNAATLEVNCGFTRHLVNLDNWLVALSSLGIFMGNVTLLQRVSEEEWGTGTFEQFEVFVVYEDLEIGDASYATIPTKQHGVVSVSDIGFGLERIAWAVSKTPSYFDLLQPITSGLHLEHHEHDALRSAALLFSCNVQPANRGPGSQLRKILKVLQAQPMKLPELKDLMRYYADFWARFGKFTQDSYQVQQTFSDEIDRLRRVQLSVRLKVSRSGHKDLEKHAEYLVYTLGIPMSEIQEALMRDTHD